jgi:hypothetical protein
MTTEALAAVKATLDGYASRGVFHGVDAGRKVGAATHFNFGWHGGRQIQCVLAPPLLTLRDFLPAVAPRSDLQKAIQGLVKEHCKPDQPAHRAIDCTRATVRTSSRGGRLSMSFESLDADYVYATQKIIFLAHEMWLLLQSDWAEYMWENLDAPVE